MTHLFVVDVEHVFYQMYVQIVRVIMVAICASYQYVMENFPMIPLFVTISVEHV
jgi:hypothetical protein